MFIKPPEKRKCTKYIVSIYFDNKGHEHIKLSSILHEDDVANLLPSSFSLDDNPSIVYSLSPTIRNKIFNYKQVVSDINNNDLQTYDTDITACNRNNSEFVDNHHDHMICTKTGDIIEFFDEELELLQEKIAQKHGYKVVRHVHQLFVKPIK